MPTNSHSRPPAVAETAQITDEAHGSMYRHPNNLKAAHTPTPWSVEGSFVIHHHSGMTVADCQLHDANKQERDEDDANAAFIVRACNNHAAYELLAVKADTLERIANDLATCKTIREAIDRKLHSKLATAQVEYREARALLASLKS